MKASVITLHTVDNYGSVMQTYATQQILKKCGYDVEFVDYWRKDNLPVNRAEKMLSNPNFTERAKPEKVAAERNKLEDYKKQYEIVVKQLNETK